MKPFYYHLIFSFLAMVFSTNTISACDRTQDSLTLVQFFQSHNGPNWTLAWDLSEPMNKWFGVTLNNQGCVEKLSLSKQFSGPFPDLQLPELEVLSLSGISSHSFTGPIPDFSGLPMLEDLTINRHDSISGGIPDFSNLPLLKKLTISRVNVSGSIPNFSQIPLLEDLYLAWMDLQGTIPHFTYLSNLKHLEIRCSQLTGTIPDFNLPKLESLNLRASYQITGPIPDFQYLPKLKVLDLGGTSFLSIISNSNLDGQIPNFSNLPMLEKLDIWFIQSNDTIPNFDQLPNLEELRIVGKSFTGKMPQLNHVPKLKTLRIGGYVTVFIGKFTNISGPIPSFSNLDNLTSLSLSLNQLSGSIPDLQLPALELLHVNSNQLTGTIPEFSHMPLLEEISFSVNKLSGTIPSFSQFPALKKVNMNWNQFDSLRAPNPLIAYFNLSNNYLTFKDILPHLGSITHYEPQKEIPVSPSYFINGLGNKTVDIHIDSQLTDNTYQWYVNNVWYDSTSMPTWEYPSSLSDLDKIYVEITNPGAADLILKTETFLLNENITSIEDEAIFPTLQIFPNPAHDRVYIDCQCEDLKGYRLVSGSGGILREALLPKLKEKIQIDVNDLPSGVYFLQLASGQGKFMSRKIVVFN